MNNGFRHEFKPSINFRLHELTNTSLTPSISYEGVIFTKKRRVRSDSIGNKIDTVDAFNYAHAVKPGISIGTSPMFFGMYTFRNSKIKQIRHSINPQLNFSATPDIRSFFPDYYIHYVENGKRVDKPKYVGTYSTPVPPSGKSANINFTLFNKLEMKYLSQNDTSSAEKKISLLDNFTITTNYDLIADSNNLSNISLSASTNLFQKFNISVSSSFNPYAVDSMDRMLRHYEWSRSNHTRLARLTSANITIGTEFSSEGNSAGQSPQKTTATLSDERSSMSPIDETEVSYNIPWRLNLNYTYGLNGWKKHRTYNHSLGFSGSLAVTKKWNVTYSSNYDFVGKALGYTNISINRDLHCWEMRFNWVPFGYAARYNFTINVKASILRDLKYTKQSDSRRSY
jgi:hypothetical protein